MLRAALVSSGLLLAVCTLACTKTDPPGTQTTASSSTATTPASAPVAQASAAPSATAPAPAAAGAFAGTYDAKASTLYLPDTPEMKKVKWRGEEVTEGLGAGDLSLTIDPDGRVHGESTGALGAMIIEGHAEGDLVAATLRRKTPADGGFTGTLEATKKNGALDGVLHVTGYDASVFREAAFKLPTK